MSEERPPQLLRDVAHHVGLTAPMLADFFNTSSEAVQRMLDTQGQIANFSILLRALGASITIRNVPAKRVSFPVESLARQFQSDVWRARHNMIRWPKNVGDLKTIIKGKLRIQTKKSLVGDLNSHGVPGPVNWNENAIQRITGDKGFTMEPRWTPAQMAKAVIVREITTAFPSPKFFDYVELITDVDPMVVILKPAPRYIQQKLLIAAKVIDGFVCGESDGGSADAQPVDQNG